MPPKSRHWDKQSSTRPRNDDTRHAVCLQKLAQILFDDASAATRRMPHPQAIAVAHDDAAMENVVMGARGGKENQIARLQMLRKLRHSRFRHALKPGRRSDESRV